MRTKSPVICVSWPNRRERENAQAAAAALDMPFSEFLRQAAAHRLEQAALDLENPELTKIAVTHRKLRQHA